MKEIYVILSHTPTFEKQQMLRSLVNKINKQDKEVMVISHTSIPKDIEDMCDYTIFDKQNELIYDSDVQFWSYSVIGDKKFEFINLKSSITILPVYKLLIGGLSYLKSLNYDIIHLLEYDCEINDFTHFNYAYDLINKDEYDLIGFKPEINENNSNECDHLLLPISFNIKKLNFDDLKYDESSLLSSYKTRFKERLFPITECIAYDMLWLKLKIKTEEYDNTKHNMLINQNYKFGYIDRYSVHTVDGVLHILHDNLNNFYPNNVDVIVTHKNGLSTSKSFLAPYFRCVWVNLGVNYDDAMFIKIFVNGSLFRELNLFNPNDRYYIDSTKITDL